MTVKTHGIKYLGSKRVLLPQLESIFKDIAPRTALDVFTGTTRVAQLMRQLGVRVTTSDTATYSRVFSHAWVSGCYNIAYVEHVAAMLNMQPGHRGWFTQNYCDVPGVKGGIVRFVTPANGMKVDFIRDEIADMLSRGQLSMHEADALIATLIMAVDRVDNTTGIQQAYLKEWCTRSQTALDMIVYKTPVGPIGNHIVGDVLTCQLPSADLAYIDPPYNQHVYSTNYHIWESLVRWDKPAVDLKTNRRIDLCGGGVATPWNRRKDVGDAFRQLLNRLDVSIALISYSSGSHMSLDELTAIVAETHDIIDVMRCDITQHIMSVTCSSDVVDRPERQEWIIKAKSRS